MADLEEEELSIGDVARQTGLSVHALRFYEREGLLLSPHVARRTGGIAAIPRKCLQIISRKVGVYERHLDDGTAQGLYTASA